MNDELSPLVPIDGLAQVKVIGIGGGGCNAVSRMYLDRIPGVDYIGINTDAQHLSKSVLPTKIRIGDKLTRGLGAGGNSELGRAAAEESREDLYEMVRSADMVFIAAGMGGGTGTGAASVVAEIARETGSLTIAIVTKPFSFEGRKRARTADDGIHVLESTVDTLIVIPNERLTKVTDETVTAEAAFRMADEVLRQGVQSIAELVTVPGEINLDFADVKTIMGGAGLAWMATGQGSGENRAIDATKAALSSPILDVSIDGARGVLFNITGGPDMTLFEMQEAVNLVSHAVDQESNIIFGMVTDQKMRDEVRVTIIATGFPIIERGIFPDIDIPEISRGALGRNEVDLDVPPFLRVRWSHAS